MNDKLNEYLQDGEQLLWSGKPTMKMPDEAHMNAYTVKAVLTVFGGVAFLMYYMLGVTHGTIPFKAAVLVLLAVLMGVILAPDWMDVGKLNKAVYAVTDRRLLVLVNNVVHAVSFDVIDAYKFDTDVADNEEQERLLTELLIKVGVTWHPRDKARALISRGVFIRK